MKTKSKIFNVVLRSFSITILVSWLLPPLQAETQGNAGKMRSGQEIYLADCANCHGVDGKGRSQSRVGFEIPFPDFTDCEFTAREPDVDWVAIAFHGGPTRGFSRLMPAFGGVLSKEELEKAVGYIRTFCPENSWPRGELNLPRAINTEKAFPEDEAILTFGAGKRLDSISGSFVYEQRFSARNQLEAVVPFGWSEVTVPTETGTASDWTSNLGDMSLGMKRVLVHSLKSGSIFSAGAEIAMPTGDEAAGFGKGTFVFEPFLSYGQILPAGFFFQSQLGFEFPFESDKAENEAFLRVVLGRTFFPGGWWGRAWSPMVEILASRELVSGEEIVWDIMPEIQVTLSARQHIMFNIGVRIPVTDASNRDFKVMAYLLWDWFDGGFFEGW